MDPVEDSNTTTSSLSSTNGNIGPPKQSECKRICECVTTIAIAVSACALFLGLLLLFQFPGKILPKRWGKNKTIAVVNDKESGNIIESNLQNDAGIMCFECGSVETAVQYLLYEPNCVENPTHARKCRPGEMCGIANVTLDSQNHFFRRCITSTTVGCVSKTFPQVGTFCGCNTDFCL